MRQIQITLDNGLVVSLDIVGRKNKQYIDIDTQAVLNDLKAKTVGGGFYAVLPKRPDAADTDAVKETYKQTMLAIKHAYGQFVGVDITNKLKKALDTASKRLSMPSVVLRADLGQQTIEYLKPAFETFESNVRAAANKGNVTSAPAFQYK